MTVGSPVANVDMTDTATGAGSITCSGQASARGLSAIYTRSSTPLNSTVFTWETWYKNLDPTNAVIQHIVSSTPSASYQTSHRGFGVLPGKGFCYYSQTYGFTGYGTISTGYTPPYNEWHHLAVSKDSSNTWRFFVDGVLYANTLEQVNWLGVGYYQPFYTDTPPLDNLYVGEFTVYYQGTFYNESLFKVEKMRVTRACRYTSNFTVPTY
jgi:hypothetical protein